MCRRSVFASLVDVCGMYIDNSLMLMGGAAVSPLCCVDGTADCSYEISHLQSQWFCALYVMIYEIFTNFERGMQLNFLPRCIPGWAVYCGSNNQRVVPFMPLTNARDKKSYFLVSPLSNIGSWESLNIFEVNLKTSLFQSYMSSGVPQSSIFICIYSAEHSLYYARRLL